MYKDMGGEMLSFGSDAHTSDRLCDRYDETVKLLKGLGFKKLFFYRKGQPCDFSIFNL
jgi:histidinol-phosphatase (PHP family)